jgi:hypothetical protein
MNQNEERALVLRTKAMMMLEEAHGLDGLQPFVVMHTHHGGESAYMVWAHDEPKKEAEIAAVLDCDFDHDSETLAIENGFTLAEITGVSPSSRLSEILTPNTEYNSNCFPP